MDNDSTNSELKYCDNCREWKPKSAFERDLRFKDKLFCRCSHCCEILNVDWKETVRLLNNAKSKLYQRANPERGRARYKEWVAKNPDRAKVSMERRRSRKLALPTVWTTENWDNALNYFKGCCAVCGRPIGFWHTLAQDHWIPLSSPDCPGTVPMNIIPLCHGIDGCNNSKSDRKPIEWLTEKFGARKAKKILERIEAYFNSLS